MFLNPAVKKYSQVDLNKTKYLPYLLKANFHKSTSSSFFFGQTKQLVWFRCQTDRRRPPKEGVSLQSQLCKLLILSRQTKTWVLRWGKYDNCLWIMEMCVATRRRPWVNGRRSCVQTDAGGGSPGRTSSPRPHGVSLWNPAPIIPAQVEIHTTRACGAKRWRGTLLSACRSLLFWHAEEKSLLKFLLQGKITRYFIIII